MWNLTHEQVGRDIAAPPATVYELVADVTRMPQLSPEVVACEWLGDDGSPPGPRVGAQFRARNKTRRGPSWSNTPQVIVAEPGREFAFARRERMFGELVWRYRFAATPTGSRVEESYQVTKQVPLLTRYAMRWFFGAKDRPADLRAGMEQTLSRLSELAEHDDLEHDHLNTAT